MNLTAKQQLSRNPSNAGYATPLKTYSIPATENQDGTINVPAQPVYGIDPNHEPIDQYMACRTYVGGIPSVLGNATDAIGAGGTGFFGGPGAASGTKRVVVSVLIEMVASATVGNRNYYAYITNEGGVVVWIGQASTAVTAAQLCNYDISFGVQNLPVSTAVRRSYGLAANTNVGVRENTTINEFLPGYVLTIRDAAGIDAADTFHYAVTFKTVAV